MSSLDEIDAEIEALVAERAMRWRRGKRVAGITELLDDAWSRRRSLEAELRNGRHPELVARARVEREIEKLMTAEDAESS